MSGKTLITFRRVFLIPTVIAAVSLVGLVAALLGDGVLDWISWAALAAPLAVLVWAFLRRRT